MSLSAPRIRAYDGNGRIIITGTGRAGTTFLVQLFTALRFDTGYSLQEALDQVDPIAHAGLERPLLSEDNPYIIKSPHFAEQLPAALAEQRIQIHAALIPVRDLFQAAESRRRVYHAALLKGLNPLRYGGSLSMTTKPDAQEQVLAQQFYKLVEALIRYEVNTIFISFPRIITDRDYLFCVLSPLLQEHGVDRQEFAEAYRRVVRPELVSKTTNQGLKIKRLGFIQEILAARNIFYIGSRGLKSIGRASRSGYRGASPLPLDGSPRRVEEGSVVDAPAADRDQV